MRLCTFQAIWDSEHREEEWDDRKRLPYEDYPDGVVWLCPFDTLENAVVSTVIVSASCPGQFLVYDVPDDMYLRIDKAKWYEYADNATDEELTHTNLHDFEAVPDLDTCLCEFVVDAKLLECASDDKVNQLSKDAIYPLQMDIIPLFIEKVLRGLNVRSSVAFVEHDGHEEEREALGRRWSDLYNDFLDNVFVQHKLDTIPDPHAIAKDNVPLARQFERLFFVTFMVPFIWHNMNSDIEDVTIYDLMPVLFAYDELVDVHNDRFIPWQDKEISDYSVDTLQNMVDDMHNMLFPGSIIEWVTFNDLPNRNDLCFCGSGKKYKKCHYKYFG